MNFADEPILIFIFTNSRQNNAPMETPGEMTAINATRSVCLIFFPSPAIINPELILEHAPSSKRANKTPITSNDFVSLKNECDSSLIYFSKVGLVRSSL